MLTVVRKKFIKTKAWAAEEQAVEWSVLREFRRLAENRGIQKQESGTGDGRTESLRKPVKQFNHRLWSKVQNWGWEDLQANQRTFPSHGLLYLNLWRNEQFEAWVSAEKAWEGHKTKSSFPWRLVLVGPSTWMRVLKLMQLSAFPWHDPPANIEWTNTPNGKAFNSCPNTGWGAPRRNNSSVSPAHPAGSAGFGPNLWEEPLFTLTAIN